SYPDHTSARWRYKEKTRLRAPRRRSVSGTISGITDEGCQVRDGLIQLTRDARQPGWWHSFRDVLPNPYEVYIGLEAGAASIRTSSPASYPACCKPRTTPVETLAGDIYLEERSDVNRYTLAFDAPGR